MSDRYQFNALRNVTDIAFDEKFLRIFYPVEKSNVDDAILKHCRRLLSLDSVRPYYALMPDFHPGEENVIGSVIPTVDTILLNQIGGDIGCGMLFLPLGVMRESIEPFLDEIFTALQKVIPTGTSYNVHVNERVKGLPILDREFRAPFRGSSFRKTLMAQTGTLGGGNHFLEIQADEHGGTGIMIHSGSRFLGVRTRDHYVKKSLEMAGNAPAKLPALPAGSEEGSDYLHDMELVMDYSRENRLEMLHRALEVISGFVEIPSRSLSENLVDCTHNYARMETHFGEELLIHRKGATSAFPGEAGIIPGSMGTSSYIVEGRGYPFSFMSCSHGAGRKYSRGDSMRRISDHEFRKSMKGIVADTGSKRKDEAPAAYKNIKDVMKYQSECVKIVRTMRPLLVVKG
jgi:tRNA-splicing ligase RtcB